MKAKDNSDPTQGPMELPLDRLAEFCRRWKIRELSVFGSAQRGDYRPDSDIDLLVSFCDDARWTLLDHFHMENELTGILGREVDLLTREAVESSHNWIRRDEILHSARILYAA